MQRVSAAFMALLLTFMLFSCSKKDSGTNGGGEIPGKPVGVSTPVGTPIDETPSQSTIGAEGGSMTSSDGRIKIIIPSGSLNANHTISIQSIINHNPLAIGNAYRIEPHNIQFSKPVTVEFNFAESEIENTIPEALGIAYQDSTGVWQARGNANIDKASGKISVTTTHFSDWSLFESLFLTSTANSLIVDGTVQLEIMSTDDLLALLTNEDEVPIGKKVPLPATFVEGWGLAGAGNLQGNGSKGTYKAPSQVPDAPNPVAISVSINLKKRGTALLVKHIEIFDDNGEIEIKVAGGPWVKKIASPAVQIEEGLYAVGDADGDTQGSYVFISWRGEKGTHEYKLPEETTGTHVHYLITNGYNYVCYFANNDDELSKSGGGVTITSMGEEDGFIKGTFTISPAGYGFDLKSKIGIEGRFRVKKGW